MSRKAKYRKQAQLGGRKVLADGQGAAKRKPQHRQHTPRHRRAFQGLREPVSP
jgi:hypothetical protein